MAKKIGLTLRPSSPVAESQKEQETEQKIDAWIKGSPNKRLNVEIPSSLHDQLKILSIKKGILLKDLVIEFLMEKIK